MCFLRVFFTRVLMCAFICFLCVFYVCVLFVFNLRVFICMFFTCVLMCVFYMPVCFFTCRYSSSLPKFGEFFHKRIKCYAFPCFNISFSTSIHGHSSVWWVWSFCMLLYYNKWNKFVIKWQWKDLQDKINFTYSVIIQTMLIKNTA